MNQKFQRTMTSLVLASVATLSLGACTDEEVSQGIGAIALIGAAVAVGAIIENNTDCQGGYKQVCDQYTDYWGHTRYECRRVYDSCLYLVDEGDAVDVRRGGRHGRHHRALDAQLTAPPKRTKVASVSRIQFAKKFDLSSDASNKFLSALDQAQDGKIAALEQLGLDGDDIAHVRNFEMPSKSGTNALAKSLNQSPANTEKMLKSLLASSKTTLEKKCASSFFRIGPQGQLCKAL